MLTLNDILRRQLVQFQKIRLVQLYFLELY